MGISWVCVELVDGIKDAPSPELDWFATGETGVSVHVGVATIEVRPDFDSSLLSEALCVVASTC